VSWTWSLLAPKGWAGIVVVIGILSGVLANIRFQDTVTIGSILTAAVIVILGGIFSFRNNMRSFWRDLAVERQEQIRVLEEHIVERDERLRVVEEKTRNDLALAAEEQRAVRHDLRTQLATAQKLLEAEHAKTDLSALMEQLGQQHKDAMARMEEGLNRQSKMLQLIEASVPHDSIPPDLRTDLKGEA
jgi:hypothetical protein